jgi:hypothetical protein
MQGTSSNGGHTAHPRPSKYSTVRALLHDTLGTENLMVEMKLWSSQETTWKTMLLTPA